MSIQSIDSLMLLLFQIGPLPYHILSLTLNTVLLIFLLTCPKKIHSFQMMVKQGLKF
uniref:ATP synthase F0 subunit 8 n=1 Tax=Trichuris discolor TaxID=483153 RepID=J7FD48_9BILA|nr:ATP synthase F0 subunit 8 [Trichuris discolor]AFK81043.1 ATP synthase F0 subunit 8 [Trichuris discolor]